MKGLDKERSSTASLGKGSLCCVFMVYIVCTRIEGLFIKDSLSTHSPGPLVTHPRIFVSVIFDTHPDQRDIVVAD